MCNSYIISHVKICDFCNFSFFFSMTIPSLSGQIYVSTSQLVVLLMIAIITMKLIRFDLPYQIISFATWDIHLLLCSYYNGYFCMLFAFNLLYMTRALCLAYIETGKIVVFPSKYLSWLVIWTLPHWFMWGLGQNSITMNHATRANSKSAQTSMSSGQVPETVT